MVVDGTWNVVLVLFWIVSNVGAILDCQQTLMLLTIQYWHYFPPEITVDIALHLCY